MKRSVTVMAMAAATFAVMSAANAKTPGRTYCFNGVCHTVKTLEETRRLVGKTTTVKASHYDDPKKDRFNPSNLTSSGEYFRAWKPDNAASPIYPNGTKLLVWHPGTRKAVTVRINNAGPYWGDRKLDLSRAAADALGMAGVATLQVRVIEAPSKTEATYSKGRTYAPVKGYMGQYASLDAAYSATNGRTAPAPALAPAVAKAPMAVAVAKPVPTTRIAQVEPLSVTPATPAKAASEPVLKTAKATSSHVTAGETLPAETPIELASTSRSGKNRKDDGDNPIAEAIRKLAQREVQTYIRLAQLR